MREETVWSRLGIGISRRRLLASARGRSGRTASIARNASPISMDWLNVSHGKPIGPAPMAQSSESDVIAGRRVLVIEDEFLIALEVQRILEEAGAREVVLVARASEALTALGAAEPFDMAVLDLLLRDEAGGPVA